MDYRLARLGALGRPLTATEQHVCDMLQDIAILKGEAGIHWQQDEYTMRQINLLRKELRELGYEDRL